MKNSPLNRPKGAMTGLLFFFLLVVITLIIYANALNGSFQFDDYGYIVRNTGIRDIGDLSRIWHAAGKPVRFVGLVTFAANYHFHKLDVFGYHVVNVLIHLANGFVLYWLLSLMASVTKIKISSDLLTRAKPLIVLIFITHPIQTQAVTYISQRLASLATLFYLLSLCLYIKGRRAEVITAKTILFIIASALAATLGMFTKQIVMTLPLVIILFEVCFISPNSQLLKAFKELRWQYLWPVLAFVFIVPAIYAFNVSPFFNVRVLSESHVGDIITNGSYFLTQSRVILTYLRLLFFPIGQNFDYDFPLSKNYFEPATLVSFLALGAISYWAIKMFPKNRLYFFGVAWFFVTLVVESSIIPIQNVIFEHRVYLPSIGFAIVSGTWLAGCLSDKRKFMAAACLIVVTLSYLTIQRNKVWQDGESFWKDAISKSPAKSRPYNNLGFFYLQENKNDLALAMFTQAIAKDPQNAKAYNNRGIVLARLQKYDQAVDDYNKALEIDEYYASALYNRGQAYRQSGEEQLEYEDFKKVLAMSPQFAERFFAKGNNYLARGNYRLALKNFNRALIADPSMVKAYLNKGGVYLYLGDYTSAIAEFDQAIVIDPHSAPAFNNRGVVYFRQKDYGNAIEDFDQAIALDQRYADAYFNRGAVLSVQRQYTRALEDYTAAIVLKPDHAAAYFQRSLVHKNLGDRERSLEDALEAKKRGYPVDDQYLNMLYQ